MYSVDTNLWSEPRLRTRTRVDLWSVEKSSLHRAFDEGRYTSVEYQIKLGMSPNVRSKEGLTPLMRCTEIRQLGSSIKLIKVLLDHGADPDLTDNEGNTLLHLAVKANNRVLARLLLTENNTNLHHQDNHGRTVLHYLAHADTDLGEMVLRSANRFYIDCDVEDKQGLTPLMAACLNNNVGMATLLVKQGKASLTKRDPHYHRNAYDWLYSATGVHYLNRPDDPLTGQTRFPGMPEPDAYGSLREARRIELLKKLHPQQNSTSPSEDASRPASEDPTHVEDRVAFTDVNDVSVEDGKSVASSKLFADVSQLWKKDQNAKSMKVLRNLYGIYEKQLSAGYRKHVELPFIQQENQEQQEDRTSRGPSRAGSGGNPLVKKMSKAVFGVGMLELRTRAKSGMRRSESGTDSSPNSLATSQDATSLKKMTSASRKILTASPLPGQE